MLPRVGSWSLGVGAVAGRGHGIGLNVLPFALPVPEVIDFPVEVRSA